MSGTFQRIIICVKSKLEPLYEHLIETLNTEKNPKAIEVHENGEIPPMINDGLSKLIVYDDLLFEKQSDINKYYIYSRKKGYSNIYISQQFFKIPLTIRQNTEYFIFGKNLLNRDLNNIYQILNTEMPLSDFKRIYRTYTKEPMNTIIIDLNLKNIRHNITDIIAEL
jgi:hypothetical protein